MNSSSLHTLLCTSNRKIYTSTRSEDANWRKALRRARRFVSVSQGSEDALGNLESECPCYEMSSVRYNVCLSLQFTSLIFFSDFYLCVCVFVRFVCLCLVDFIYQSLSTRSLTSTFKYIVLLCMANISREAIVLLHLHTLLIDILSPHKSSLYKPLFVNYRNQSQIRIRMSSCQNIYAAQGSNRQWFSREM